MPGTNGGTGYPFTLRCGKCRTSRARRDDPKRGLNLVATGRTRSAANKGIRQTNRRIEYECLDCGHAGWTQHMDAERLTLRKMPF
jgi:hypothetical protein